MALRRLDSSMIDMTGIRKEIDEKIDSIKLSMKIYSEEIIAEEGQKSFVLKNVYNIETDNITVEVGGVEQFVPENFIKTTDENGVTTISFKEGLPKDMDIVISYYGGSESGNALIQNHINNVHEKHISVVDSVNEDMKYKGSLALKVSESTRQTPSAPINR